MSNNIKSFLGKSPIKIINSSDRSPQVTNIMGQVGTFLEQKSEGLTKLVIPELGITGLIGFRLTLPIVVLSKTETYIPIKASLRMDLYSRTTKKLASATYSPADVFFINGVGSRPNPTYLFKHFLALLKAPYPGSLDISAGRYAFILTNLRGSFIDTLLYIATHSKEEVIDYSWLVPLQTLLEFKEDNHEKPKRSLAVPSEDDFLTPPDVDQFVNRVAYDEYRKMFKPRNSVLSA